MPDDTGRLLMLGLGVAIMVLGPLGIYVLRRRKKKCPEGRQARLNAARRATAQPA